MPNRIITAAVTGETIKLSNKTAGAAGSFNAVSLSLTFDSAWDGTTKKLYFFDAYGNNAVYRLLTTDLLVGDAYIVPIPAEPLAYAGEMTITIRGIDFATDGTTAERIIMSASTTMKVLSAIAPASDVAPVEPTPTQAEQLQGEIDDIKGDIAYVAEIAGTIESSVSAASASASAAANSATAAATSATAAQTAQTAAEAAKTSAESTASAFDTHAATVQASFDSSVATANATIDGKVTTATNAATTAQAAQTASESARDAAISAKTDAQTAETNAGTYATNAGNSATAAAGSAADANSAKVAAQTAQTAAETAKTHAETAKMSAETAETNATAKAVLAESYAKGGTGTRPGEDTDNALYYKNQAREIVGGDYPTKSEAQGYVTTHDASGTAHSALFGNKVDKVAGKGLSTEDYTSAEKTKLAGIAEGAEANVNPDWNATEGYAQILNKPTIDSTPTPNSTNLVSSGGVYTALEGKQNKLTAGTNISISGDTISSTGGLPPTITVTAPTGSTVTAVLGATTLSATESSGTWVFNVTAYGTWTINATLGTQSASGTVVVDTVKQYALELSYAKIYGISWSGGPSTVWTRTDDAAGFSDPVPALSNGNGSSPFDSCYPWNGMVKESRAGGVMVKIPKFWFKWTKNGSTLTLQIADKAVDGFSVSPAHMDRGDGKGERDYVYVGRYHCNSSYLSATGANPIASITRASARSSIHAKGSTIWQMDYAMRLTIWMLMLVEFADNDFQAKIGYGCGNDSAAGAMGYTDSMTYHTGTTQSARTTYGLGTQYRYIEGLWDNVRDWMDGCYYSSSGMSVIKNPANFSDTANGTVIGTPTSGYPSVMSLSTASGFEWCIYPTASAGSTTTYFPDVWGFSASDPCLYAGGSYSQDLAYGAFFVYYAYASNANANIGCRLQELP